MPSTAPIKVPITGVDKYTKEFNKLNAKVGKMGRGIKNAGRKMTTSLTLPILAFGAAAARAGIQFDDSMRRVQAKADATAKDMSAIRTEAKKLGSETRYTAVQAGEGFEKLAMAGWSASDMLKAMRPTLNLAAAAGAEVAQTADVMSDTMGAFAIEASKAGMVADVMAAALTSANIDMDTYADSMKYVAPVAKEFGMSIQEASAAVGFLGNVGIKGTQAGTGMRKMMLSLATASGGAAREMKKLGVNVVGGDKKLKSFNAIMGEMSKAFVTQGASQKGMLSSLKKIFGERAITGAAAMSSALKDGGNALVGLTVGLNKLQPGKAQAMADIMEGGAGGQWRKMVSAWEALQIAFAESGLLEEVVNIMKDLADGMREMAQSDPNMLKKIVKALGALALLGPALMTIGQVVSGVAALATAFGGVGGAGGLAAAATAVTGPVGLVIAGIAAVASIAIYCREEIKPLTAAIAGPLKTAFGELTGMFDGAEVSGEGFGDSLKYVVGGISETIAPAVELTVAMNPMLLLFRGLVAVGKGLIYVFKLIASAFGVAYEWVAKIGGGLDDSIKKWMNASAAGRKFRDTMVWIGEAVGGVADFVVMLWDKVAGFFGAVGDWLDSIGVDLDKKAEALRKEREGYQGGVSGWGDNAPQWDEADQTMHDDVKIAKQSAEVSISFENLPDWMKPTVTAQKGGELKLNNQSSDNGAVMTGDL